MGCSRRQGSATHLHDRVGVLRLGLTLVLTLMLALVVAKPAMAGEARVVVNTGGKVALEYEAGPGETNTVTVTQSTSSFTVSDTTAPVTAGAGCTVAAATATCADPSALGAIQTIAVDLADGDDLVDIEASIPSELLGRAGVDDLTGGDGFDVANGGPGADRINVRGPGKDNVRLCDATDAVISDPDDIVPAECTNNNVAPVTTITGGPQGPTNETAPVFTFMSVDPDVTRFECLIDGFDEGPAGCDSGVPQRELPEGPYFFRVRAYDDIPGAPGPWTTRPFNVDTSPPQVNVTGPQLSTTAQPTYDISSPDPSAPVTFECAIDQGAFAACSSPYTTPALANGAHVIFVRGTDAAGNSTTTESAITVQVTPGGGGGGGGGSSSAAPVQPSKIIIESLVLISGRTVKMSRKGEVSISLQCAGSSTCKGRMTITTAEPVKRRSRKLERLGSTKFSIAANKKKNVKVRFSKSKRKLAKRLKRFKAKVVITEVDKRGNARVSSRVFVMRAR